MDSNEEIVQKHVVVHSPGQQSEVITERTERGPRESSLSTSTIAIIAILAFTAVAAIFYIVINRNAHPSVASVASDANTLQAPPTTIIQQPAPAQQAPVIIQQPAPAPQAPVVQQPAQPSQRENTSANDDANMQDIATKRLTQELDMAGVVMTITDARAVLTGTVNSEATKAKAELIVKGVRGVKSVDNKIIVSIL